MLVGVCGWELPKDTLSLRVARSGTKVAATVFRSLAIHDPGGRVCDLRTGGSPRSLGSSHPQAPTTFRLVTSFASMILAY